MKNPFTIPKDVAFHIREKEKEYPWPCKPEPDRKIMLYDDDVLTKSENGTWVKHTGLCCVNIQIPDEDLVQFDKDVHLALL